MTIIVCDIDKGKQSNHYINWKCALNKKKINLQVGIAKKLLKTRIGKSGKRNGKQKNMISYLLLNKCK